MTATAEPIDEGTTTGPVTAHFRYPGSPPFQDDELDRALFQGRAREAERVLHAILSSDLFLLYSVSGLGKSSLLNAGVLHPLRERDHWPVRLRLNDPSVDPITEIGTQIRDAAAADPTVELAAAPDAPGTDRTSTLWDLLASVEVWRHNELQRPVLVFDQFEELFTLGWDPEVRQRFIEDLGEVVRGHRRPGRGSPTGGGPVPEVKFVLVIREDALGELEALAGEVPQVMRNRFRLGPLDAEQAEAAVRAPGRIDDDRLPSPRFTYTPAAIRVLLDFLGRAAGEATSPAAAGTHPGIDPSQLQIICQYIEREIVQEKAAGSPPGTEVEIDADDLGGTEGLERILGSFYRRSIEQFPPARRPPIRTLCETGLINADGRRLSLEEGDIESRYGVDRETLERLVDERLMRVEPRVGSLYYEIAHDTLVGPILEDREQRETARRRRRRNRLFGVLLVVAVLAGVTAAFLLLRDDETGGTQAAAPLALEETETGSIAAGGDSARYTIDADPEEAIVVSVVPAAEDLNPTVEITTADGVTRIEDRNGAGQAEHVVVPPATGDDPGRQLRVTSLDSSTGDFEVSTRTETVTELVPPDQLDAAVSDTSVAEDAVAVFVVEVDGEEPADEVEVTVTPWPGSDGPLDVAVTTIDPAGKGEGVNDSAAGKNEAVVLRGEGLHHVVVSGQGSTEGDFLIRAAIGAGSDPSEAELPPPDQPEPLELGTPVVRPAEPDAARTFLVAGSEDQWTGVLVQPDELLDPVMTVTSGDEAFEVDWFPAAQREYVVLPPGTGDLTVEVRSFDEFGGDFEITASRVSPTPFTPPARWDRGPVTYRVATPDPEQFLVLDVEGGPAAEMLVEAYGDGPDPLYLWNFAGPGRRAQILLNGAEAESYTVTVTPSDDFAFRSSVDRPERMAIRPGEPLEGTGPVVLAVEVAAGQAFELLVEPDEFTEVSAVVVDPDGGVTEIPASGGWGDPIQAVIGEFGPGTYQVALAPVEGEGDWEATLGSG